MSARNLVIFHDSPQFGGHERVFLKFLPELLASAQISQITLSYYEGNHAFASAISPHAGDKLKLRPTVFRKRRGEPYFSPLRLDYRKHAISLLGSSGADLVLLLQGRIENTLVPLRALSSRVPVVSYLPMAHSVHQMGLGGRVAGAGDFLRRHYYRMPGRFIVPSQTVAGQLRNAGVCCDVRVIENPLEAGLIPDRASSLIAHGLSPIKRIALFLGRFDTHQKGLDQLVADMERASDLSHWQFLFVGQGPGRDLIEAVLARNPLRLTGRVIEWTSNPASMLAVADVLLLPSRYEGVPLVMLEAVAAGLPILSSNIDAYREYLPEANRMQFGNGEDLGCALQRVVSESAVRDYRAHARALVDRLSGSNFARRFAEALLDPLPSIDRQTCSDPEVD